MRSLFTVVSADEWRKACAIELEQFVRQKLFTQGEWPMNRCVIGSRWVFKRKYGPDGMVLCYKACLVAQGFSQVEGVDYNADETFLPVTSYSTIRTLLALAARHGWKVCQFDAKSAFTNPKLDREIYMRIPASADGHRTEDVWLLHCALYGLKQASREWYMLLYKLLRDLGYKRNTVDHGLFYKNIDGVLVILAVWVDDFITVSPSDNAIDILRTNSATNLRLWTSERSSGF